LAQRVARIFQTTAKTIKKTPIAAPRNPWGMAAIPATSRSAGAIQQTTGISRTIPAAASPDSSAISARRQPVIGASLLARQLYTHAGSAVGWDKLA